MGLVFRHPEPGEMVGDYRILKKIGSGGFGTVFKAERAGLFFAVKMLRSHELGARERREISILLELEHPCVVRFRACDRWLEPKMGTPYIVTDFVPGLTLEEFADEENPPARESARLTLETARTLGEVHLQGVFHRDLKPENIIIPGKNERPILIDFGVGSYAGARVITPYGQLRGTFEYRSPEAYLFNRANTELAHYEFSAADELWALGVTFYWLLTHVLPFGDRNDGEGGGLVERIIHQRPVAPHVLNPRVPRALSDLCMKMLEKKPEDRYRSVVELCTALEGALAEAEADATWDLPLFDPDSPEEAEAPQALAPFEAPRAAAAPLPPGSRRRARFAVAAGLAAVVFGAFLFARSLSPARVPTPPDTSAEATTTRQAESGREVAQSTKPLDPPGGEGAEPTMGFISAPVMITMLSKDDTREKPQEKKAKVLGPAVKTIGTGFVCVALTGCPAPQVRPTPKPAPCPAGAVEAMADKLGVRLGDKVSLYYSHEGPSSVVTAHEGSTSVELGPIGLKEGGDIFLSGTLTLGEKRVYGRFTQAHNKETGETFPVCFEMRDALEGGRGAIIHERGGSPDTASIPSMEKVKAVRSFE